MRHLLFAITLYSTALISTVAAAHEDGRLEAETLRRQFRRLVTEGKFVLDSGARPK